MSINSINSSQSYSLNTRLVSSKESEIPSIISGSPDNKKLKQDACKARWDKHFSNQPIRREDGNFIHRSSNLSWYEEKIKFLKVKIEMNTKKLLSKSEIKTLTDQIDGLLSELLKLQSDCKNNFKSDRETQSLEDKIAELQGMKDGLKKGVQRPKPVSTTIFKQTNFGFQRDMSHRNPKNKQKPQDKFPQAYWILPLYIFTGGALGL